MRAGFGRWRMEGRLYSEMETLGLDTPCYFRSKSRILLPVLATHPVHEVASDSSSPREFGREGQLFLRLCGKTEATWKIVSGWVRQRHGHAWNYLQFQPFLTVAQGNPDGASHLCCAIQTIEVLSVKYLGSGCAQNSFSLIHISSS